MHSFENSTVKITVIVVVYNEQKYLRECLKGVSSCDQLIVIDLGSTDSSLKVAQEFTSEIHYHPWVPLPEYIREEVVVSYARNEWILFVDPDEIYNQKLLEQCRQAIATHPNLAALRVPTQYFFKGKMLHSTVWGGNDKTKAVLFHRDRVSFLKGVHVTVTIHEGYEMLKIERECNNFVAHYWVDSYRELFLKHRRYIQTEGQTRYRLGQRFSWRSMGKEVAGSLFVNFVTRCSLRDGLHGLFLGSFHAWYVCMAWLSLRRFQQQYERHVSE